jgi:hypothetical protein
VAPTYWGTMLMASQGSESTYTALGVTAAIGTMPPPSLRASSMERYSPRRANGEVEYCGTIALSSGATTMLGTETREHIMSKGLSAEQEAALATLQQSSW